MQQQHDYKVSRQKMPKQRAPCKCLSIILFDSVIKAKKMYYPQALLEECKYELEKIEIKNLTNDELEKHLPNRESDNDEDNDECNEQFYPRDYETLAWCPAGPVLPHGEKVPL